MKSKFDFKITFAAEDKLTGNKLKKSIDEYHHFIPGTTKNIKPKKPVSEPCELDDNITRYHVGTKVYKSFDGIEYEGEIKGYSPITRYYQVEYEDLIQGCPYKNGSITTNPYPHSNHHTECE